LFDFFTMRSGDLAESLIFFSRPLALFWREFAPVFQAFVQALLLFRRELRIVLGEF